MKRTDFPRSFEELIMKLNEGSSSNVRRVGTRSNFRVTLVSTRRGQMHPNYLLPTMQMLLS